MTREIFENIGGLVEREWHAAKRDPAAFADIAARVLEAQELRARLDPDELLRYVQTAPYPDQTDENTYGEPAISLVRGDGFRVEVIFWMDRVARPHTHAAEGAFCVLAGERLHATYVFEPKETPAPGLVLGDLQLRHVEVLAPGDVRKIGSGLRMFHALTFIGRPCVTVSVRALEGEASVPFHVHANEHAVAVPALLETHQRRLSALATFIRIHPSEALAMSARVLAEADVLMAHALIAASPSLLAAARERFGGWIDKLLASEELKRRRYAIEALLLGRTERAHCIFLGLVWMGADRRATFELLERWFPGEDPLALIDRCIVEIRGRRAPSDELGAMLGITTEDDVSAQLREFRRRLAS